MRMDSAPINLALLWIVIAKRKMMNTFSALTALGANEEIFWTTTEMDSAWKLKHIRWTLLLGRTELPKEVGWHSNLFLASEILLNGNTFKLETLTVRRTTVTLCSPFLWGDILLLGPYWCVVPLYDRWISWPFGWHIALRSFRTFRYFPLFGFLSFWDFALEGCPDQRPQPRMICIKGQFWEVLESHKINR